PAIAAPVANVAGQEKTSAAQPAPRPATAIDTPARMFVLDVPGIAERVNDVVVNVRSLAEGGENIGSGFIIDSKGLIATNFHLINAAEGRRTMTPRGQDTAQTKLVNNVTVTLHDGRQFPASIKGYDEATDIAV